MFRKSLALAIGLLLVGSIGAMACGNEGAIDAQKANVTTAMESPQEVTLQGQLVCLGCSLKADGAKAACSEFGHSHSLKTADGQYVSFLHNQFSKGLVAGEKAHNKQVEVTGTYFANANMLDVKSYTVDGGKTQSWCDGCKGMDACKASH